MRRKLSSRIIEEKVEKKPLLVRVGEWWDGVSYFHASMVFLGVLVVLFGLSTFWVMPDIEATRDVMRVIYEWNGQRTTLDFNLAFIIIFVWITDVWLRYRVGLPQGALVTRKRGLT